MEQSAQTQGGKRHRLTGSGSAIAQPQIERRNGGGGDHQSFRADAEEEGLRQDIFVPGTRLLPHNFIGMRLQAKGDGGQGIRQQIDEQQMDCRKRHWKPHERGVQNRQDLGGIAGEQKLNGPLDVGIHVPSVLYRLHNGGEVVVCQHHTGRVLGDLCSRDPHCNANVRLL